MQMLPICIFFASAPPHIKIFEHGSRGSLGDDFRSILYFSFFFFFLFSIYITTLQHLDLQRTKMKRINLSIDVAKPAAASSLHSHELARAHTPYRLSILFYFILLKKFTERVDTLYPDRQVLQLQHRCIDSHPIALVIRADASCQLVFLIIAVSVPS